MEKYATGGYLKIVKEGTYKGVEYHPEEIWRITQSVFNNVTYEVEREGKIAIVCVEAADRKYGLEAVWVEPIESPLIFN